MVNPERRANIEDIANHWWVNWSYKSSVCDCDVLKDSESPLLARFINWHQRSTSRQLEAENKSKCLLKPSEVSLERQRSLKKSKKGNDITQSLQDGPEETTISKRPKSILKKRSNSEHRCHSASFIEGVISPVLSPTYKTESDKGIVDACSNNAKEVGKPILCGSKQSTPLPKKGILKKTQQRESGYYSSPERSESSELLDNDGTDSGETSQVMSETKRTVSHSLSCRRKGILKHNSKYSNSSSASPMSSSTTESLKSMEHGLLPGEGLSRSYSRPSSVISDDSILSNDSFDLLELTGGRPNRQRIRSCVSAENVLYVKDFERLQKSPRPQNLKRFRNRFADSSFSLLTDMDDVTQVYKKALEICNKLN